MKIFMLILLFCTTTFIYAQEKQPITFQDVMRFNEIKSPVISQDGKWLALQLRPERGDGYGIIQNTDDSTKYKIERGSKPKISKNNQWAAFTVDPPLLKSENAKKKDKPKNGLTVIHLEDGKQINYDHVMNYMLSENGSWLAVHFSDTTNKNDDKAPIKKGTELLLNYLPDSSTINLPFVTEFAFDSLSTYLAAAIRDTSSQTDRIVRIKLDHSNLKPEKITSSPFTYYSKLAWSNQGEQLSFVTSSYDSFGYPQPGRLDSWHVNNGYTTIVSAEQIGEDWTIPFHNELKFSRDGKRLFFGRLPAERFKNLYSKEEEIKFEDVTDETILIKKSEVDVWHWNDSRINSNQKKEWEKNGKQTFTAVYFNDTKRYIPLADEKMPFVEWNENDTFALGRSDVPYLKFITWEGWFYDYYRVDLNNGKRERIVERIESTTSFSPGGQFVVYYHNKHWFLVNLKDISLINLTDDLDIPFDNEDHDYPQPPPGYGVAGWIEKDQAILIYDKYDVWQFFTNGDDPLCITGGRDKKLTFRVKKLDPEKKYFEQNETLLLEGYHQKLKYTAVFKSRVGIQGITELRKANKKIKIISKAKDNDRLIYTEQSYKQFPDLRLTDSEFSFSKQLTDANPQMSELLWGDAELVEWETEDDIPLQGVLIKPANYKPEKRYPVLVYYYRLFSQRLYDFNQPKINHRPCFPLYTSNGYAIFLPDIKFKVGDPGPSATKCLVSGVEYLIDEDIADPDAIGLHGHSWSGYQTAFVITETDMFKCAIAGAPVSNMTSAYSGIRWGTGLARQFQYEKSQSRIGGTLVEMPEKYIKNSPVFFADRINTPLLLMFGDVDEAVPWYQGIELYLALRRFNKDCIFLQYRDEPHHLKKYPNRMDYAKRMKEYFDYHLKSEKPAPWIIDGMPYSGK